MFLKSVYYFTCPAGKEPGENVQEGGGAYKMLSSSDQTEHTAASTTICLPSAELTSCSSSLSSSVVFNSNLQQERPASVTTKRKLIGYGPSRLTENTFYWSLSEGKCKVSEWKETGCFKFGK